MKTLPLTTSFIVAVACLLQTANAQSTFDIIESPTQYTYVPTIVEHSAETFHSAPPVVWVKTPVTFDTPIELSTTDSQNQIIEKAPSAVVVQATPPTVTKTEALPVKATVQVQIEAPVYSAPIVPYYSPAPAYSAVCMSGG